MKIVLLSWATGSVSGSNLLTFDVIRSKRAKLKRDSEADVSSVSPSSERIAPTKG